MIIGKGKLVITRFIRALMTNILRIQYLPAQS